MVSTSTTLPLYLISKLLFSFLCLPGLLQTNFLHSNNLETPTSTKQNMITAASSIASNTSSWTTPQSTFPPSSTSIDLGFLSKSMSLKKKKKKNKPIMGRATKQALISKETSETPKPLTPPYWNPLQRAAAMAIDAVESALVSHELQHPLPKSADPVIQLAGNFSPVPEQPVHHSLPITGTIPDCINGVYLRNGPNPLFKPIAGHNFFDGDGMVHAVTIQNGAASYACRFTETERLLQERKLGRPVFPKTIGEIHGHAGIIRLLMLYLRGLFGLVDLRRGLGPVNTGLVFFNGKLLAMSEEDLPYELQITPSGDLKTVGRYNFDGQLKSSMIAHPKIDPESGELFVLSCAIPTTKLTYIRFSPDGKKSSEVNIMLPVPTMVHDFVITKNFVVVPDHKVVFKVEDMMIKDGSPVIFDEKKKSRFGILPKYAENASDIIWIESPDTFCFHLWNAWEEPETNEVVVIGSCMNSLGSIFHDDDESERFKSVLTEIRLNLKTRESTRRPILLGEDLNLEVGTVNQKRLGRKTRYAYLAIVEPWPKVSGFVKVDLVRGKVVKRYMYGEGRFGGEPFFLARGKDDDDDGYVMVLVHDESTCMSELHIVNAVDLKVEAMVKLPSRVPYGLHGTFVDADDLAQQF